MDATYAYTCEEDSRYRVLCESGYLLAGENLRRRCLKTNFVTDYGEEFPVFVGGLGEGHGCVCVYALWKLGRWWTMLRQVGELPEMLSGYVRGFASSCSKHIFLLQPTTLADTRILLPLISRTTCVSAHRHSFYVPWQ